MNIPLRLSFSLEDSSLNGRGFSLFRSALFPSFYSLSFHSLTESSVHSFSPFARFTTMRLLCGKDQSFFFFISLRLIPHQSTTLDSNISSSLSPFLFHSSSVLIKAHRAKYSLGKSLKGYGWEREWWDPFLAPFMQLMTMELLMTGQITRVFSLNNIPFSLSPKGSSVSVFFIVTFGIFSLSPFNSLENSFFPSALLCLLFSLPYSVTLTNELLMNGLTYEYHEFISLLLPSISFPFSCYHYSPVLFFYSCLTLRFQSLFISHVTPPPPSLPSSLLFISFPCRVTRWIVDWPSFYSFSLFTHSVRPSIIITIKMSGL